MKRRNLTWTASAATVLLFVVTPATAAAGAAAEEQSRLATPSPKVTVEDLALDLTGVTADWRVDVAPDGRAQVVWGDNPDVVPVVGEVVQSGQGATADAVAEVPSGGTSVYGLEAEEGALMAASAGVTCALLVGNVYKINSPLQGDAQQSCFGPFGRHRISHKFQRSSWSGMRDFTTITNTSWSYSTEIYRVFTAPCNSAGGSYQYNLWAQGYADAIGLSPSQTSRNLSSQFKCGTGVS